MKEAAIPCSVAILTRNSAATLPRALESVQDFAETLICDGGSTDATLEIARAAGARIIEQDPAYKDARGRIIDFGGVRNQTFAAATQPWFFFLDSDEYASPALVDEIRRIASGRPAGAYFVIRRYVLNGVEIDCAYSYPNRSMRFFARADATGFIKKVHERIKLKERVSAGTITAPIFVPVDLDIARGRQKGSYYIALQVAQAGDYSFATLLEATGHTIRASAAYAFRFLRNLIFCRGNRLPFVLEFEAHVYHVMLLKEYWGTKLSRIIGTKARRI